MMLQTRQQGDACSTAGPLDFSLHPGAEKYFREEGYL